MTDRVVALIDMDCFYCQVESREKPELQGKPMAVVQYNAWQGGGIIAVSYEARAFGVKRNMRGDEAKKLCPDIVLVQVPEVRGKADLSKYRNASKEVISVFMEFGAIVERASIDEAYVDLTTLVTKCSSENFGNCIDKLIESNTFIVGNTGTEEREAWFRNTLNPEVDDAGNSDDVRLAVGANIVDDMRAAVLQKTGFKCSAGVSRNKVLAKFACGLNKPNKQTILPSDQIEGLFSGVKIGKVRGLGGKLGDSVCEAFNVETMGELAKLSMADLQLQFDRKTANWLFNMAKGIDEEEVQERNLPKSIGCGKNFRGPEILDTREKVEKWMNSLCQELSERLMEDKAEHQRVAKTLHVGVSLDQTGHVSRSGPLFSYETEKIAKQAMQLIAKLNEQPPANPNWKPKLRNISLSVSKFTEREEGKVASISEFFKNSSHQEAQDVNSEENKAESKDQESVQAKELVPSLENYDPNLLELLPKKLRNAVLKRVEFLKQSAIDLKENDVEETIEDKNEATTSEAVGFEVAEELQKCEKCGKSVSPFDLPEHLDFHLAQDLQRQIRKEDFGKRKLPEKCEDKQEGNESKKQKTIMSFFKKN